MLEILFSSRSQKFLSTHTKFTLLQHRMVRCNK